MLNLHLLIRIDNIVSLLWHGTYLYCVYKGYIVGNVMKILVPPTMK